MAELTLLLVDDEVEFIEPTATRLRRRGIACTTVQSGDEALRALREPGARFDGAIVDVKMPGMDGLTLLGSLRLGHRGLPVILLTGHASVELGVQGMELGAFEYLMKPVDLDELLDVVRRAVDAKR